MEKKDEKNAEDQGEGDEELYCRKLVSRASEGIRNLAQMHRNFFFLVDVEDDVEMQMYE